MKRERKIIAYKNYFVDFIKTLKEDEVRKIFYIIDMLKTQERLSTRFVKHIESGIYELRVTYKSNIYRVFFIFDADNIIILFNGFQKKTQKTPRKEVEQALKLRDEYYESKK